MVTTNNATRKALVVVVVVVDVVLVVELICRFFACCFCFSFQTRLLCEITWMWLCLWQGLVLLWELYDDTTIAIMDENTTGRFSSSLSLLISTLLVILTLPLNRILFCRKYMRTTKTKRRVCVSSFPTSVSVPSSTLVELFCTVVSWRFLDRIYYVNGPLHLFYLFLLYIYFKP